MKQVSLSGSLRENVGKKDARKQRRSGFVPCVIYGGKEQVHFATDEKNLSKVLFSPKVYIVKIEAGGQSYETIVQDLQFHPVTDRLLHVDFMEIHAEKPVIISVPVYTTGTPKGVLRGGKLVKKMRKLKLKALPANLPDDVTVQIEDLDIGQSVKVGDLRMENVTFLDSPSNVIAAVQTARQVTEEVPGAAAAEGEKKEEGK